MKYKTKGGFIVAIDSDGNELKTIPCDASNRDYAEYLSWVLAGNVATIDMIDTLAYTQQIAWRKIKALRESKQYSLGVKVGDYWFHSDATSRIQYLGLAGLGTNFPANLQWKTMSGDYTTLTAAMVTQITVAIATLDITVFTEAESHKAALEALTTVDAVEAYDIESGWSVGYTG